MSCIHLTDGSDHITHFAQSARSRALPRCLCAVPVAEPFCRFFWLPCLCLSSPAQVWTRRGSTCICIMIRLYVLIVLWMTWGICGGRSIRLGAGCSWAKWLGQRGGGPGRADDA